MARKKKHEEHVNTEAWAIPYGDLITLLLAFFVVMYSMSSVNEGKFRILSDALVAAFRGAPSTMSPINVGENQAVGKGGEARLDGVAPTTLIRLKRKATQNSAADLSIAVPSVGGQKKPPSAGTGPGNNGGDGGAGSALARMAGEIRVALQPLINEGDVRIRHTPSWLEVEIRTDILFDSGVARVSGSAGPIVQKLAAILGPFPNPVRVEGHTDNRPIRTTVFPSNWELSAARAANVVHLMSSGGIAPGRMEVIGFGEHRPIAPNTTADGRNRNRRVLIVVMEGRETAGASLADAPSARAGEVPLASVGPPIPAPTLLPH